MTYLWMFKMNSDVVKIQCACCSNEIEIKIKIIWWRSNSTRLWSHNFSEDIILWLVSVVNLNSWFWSCILKIVWKVNSWQNLRWVSTYHCHILLDNLSREWHMKKGESTRVERIWAETPFFADELCQKQQELWWVVLRGREFSTT